MLCVIARYNKQGWLDIICGRNSIDRCVFMFFIFWNFPNFNFFLWATNYHRIKTIWNSAMSVSSFQEFSTKWPFTWFKLCYNILSVSTTKDKNGCWCWNRSVIVNPKYQFRFQSINSTNLLIVERVIRLIIPYVWLRWHVFSFSMTRIASDEWITSIGAQCGPFMRERSISCAIKFRSIKTKIQFKSYHSTSAQHSVAH